MYFFPSLQKKKNGKEKTAEYETRNQHTWSGVIDDLS